MFEKEAYQYVDQPLFDTLTYPRDLDREGRLLFFTKQLGFDGKTREDTNLYLPNQLPSPQMFLVRGWSVMVLEDPARLPWRLFYSGSAELCIGQMCYQSLSPLSTLYSIDGRSPGHPITPELLIQSAQNFVVQLTWLRPLKVHRPLRFRVSLHGLLYRPIL
jgi:hypothetical protein